MPHIQLVTARYFMPSTSSFAPIFNSFSPVTVVVRTKLLIKSPRNLPNCTILGKLGFQNFISAVEPYAKALRILKNYALVNNNLYGKLVSSSPIIFDEIFKVT